MPVTRIELIDTHIHLDDDRFDEDRDQVISRAIANGVCTMIVPATTRERWEKIQAVCDQYPGVMPTCGLHPLFMEKHTEADLAELEEQADSDHCIAIGECGLDRHCLKQQHGSTNDLKADTEALFFAQQFYFESQLSIAAKFDLPVIVHARLAVEDVILSIKKSPATTGVVHSFNGSKEQAGRLIDLGYRLSFGGAATHPRAKKIRQLIKTLPADSILIETDAPDQTGHANHNQRNEPAYLVEVLQTVADLRNNDVKSMACQLNENALALFSRIQTIGPAP